MSRIQERLAEFAQASSRLDEVCAMPGGDVVRDATIQRFEFTFELFWKTAQLYLEDQGMSCPGPRPTLKAAFTFGIIPDATEADIWLRMMDDRNLTSHTYRSDLAVAIHARILSDYAPLLHRAVARLRDRIAG